MSKRWLRHGMYGTLVEVNFAAVVIITFLKKLAYPEAYEFAN